MGRRRKDRALPKDVPPLVGRIDWLLKEYFGNNITLLAEVLGASHAALSRVLVGQLPSGKMLEALVQRAYVDPLWLLGGATQGERGRGPGAVLCPVADALLPGEPRAYPERLSAFSLPMACAFVVEQAYWYRVRTSDPITEDESSRVAAGDYLLIEGSERWTRRPEAFAGRMVALRMSEGDTVVLGQVAAHEAYFEEPQHEVRMFGTPEKAALYLRLRATAAAKPARPLDERPDLVAYFLDDVAGVVLQVSRLLERGH
jgi:hypothetical protein